MKERGRSIRYIKVDMQDEIECTQSDHMPNKETKKVIEDTIKGKGLIRGKKAKAITKKLGL